jgi:hypothetical protein
MSERPLTQTQIDAALQYWKDEKLTSEEVLQLQKDFPVLKPLLSEI